MKKAVFVCLILILLASCSVTSSIVFDSQFLDGNQTVELETTEFFKGVAEDLSSWNSDEDIIQSGISELETNLSYTQSAEEILVTESDGKYNISFNFDDYEYLVEELSGDRFQKLLTVSQINGKTKLKLSISMETYDEIEEAVPFLRDKNIAVYGPRYNEDLTEEDYLEMMQFIFSDQASSEIKDSVISISIKCPSNVTASSGKTVDKNTVLFEIPLIDFLLLHDPIVLEAEF